MVRIALGGVTVLLKLPDLVSTAHLVNALLILAALIVLALGLRGAAVAAADRPRRLARVGMIVLLVQLALGGYVRHSGAGLACPDFPLCSGDVLPTGWLPAFGSIVAIVAFVTSSGFETDAPALRYAIVYLLVCASFAALLAWARGRRERVLRRFASLDLAALVAKLRDARHEG